MRTLAATLAGLLLPIAVAAAPIRITGRILHPPQDVQVELRPWAADRAEALRKLKGEAVPPLASARPGADGSFAIQVPESGFYSFVVRAEGRLALERFIPFVVEDRELPPVELPPVSPLEVKAVGPDGQPLAGVVIQAIPVQKESGEWRAAERRAVTDAEGRAVFPRVEGEALNLVITTPGRYATASTSPTGASQTVRFPAPRSRTVEFRGPGGRPAAGALVRLALRGWPYGLTGEDGRIALPEPEAAAIGFFAEDSRGLRVEAVAGPSVFTLGPPATVSGRVLDAASREPIPGALVWNSGSAWMRTGPGGAFELRAPSGDRGAIRATAAGRMVHIGGWMQDRDSPLTFLLETAASISGQVVDGQGRPVAGVLVTTLAHHGEDYSIVVEERSSTSGPDGRFLLEKLPARRLHWVEAVREGYAPTRQLADSTAPARLVLRRGALAFGRVVDDEGLPVDGAQVTLDPVTAGEAPTHPQPFQATSDSAGRFRLPGVSAGWFSLQVERKGFADAFVSEVAVPEEETEVDLGEIRLPAGGAIEGLVTDARGRPVEGAAIWLRPSDRAAFGKTSAMLGAREPLLSSADGRFRIEDLPRGLRFDLQVQANGLLPAGAPGVEVPTPQPVRIRLDPPRTLSGRVVDPLGEPVAGARVTPMAITLLPDGSRQGEGIEQTATDPEGRFVFSLVRPGRVDVEASAAGYRKRTVEIEVPEDGEAEPVEIVLEAGTSLEGRVLDSQGFPRDEAQIEVQCRHANGQLGSFGSTDEEGRYEIADLEPGACEVEVSLFNRSRGFQTAVELRPGRNRLDLQFPAGAEVSGRVLDGRGEPMPGATLSLAPVQQDGGLPALQATSSADGSFAFADVADGEYRLTATRRGFGPSAHPGEIRVAGAPVGGLEMRLLPGAVIRGRILGCRPEELRGASVMAFSAWMEVPLTGTVSSGGAYRIDGVGPGESRVIARLPPDISIEGTVEVPEGAEEAVLDLELPPGFTLTGRVVLDREPLAGARVMASASQGLVRRQGETGQDGAFRLERLPAGSYILLVQLSPTLEDTRMLEIDGDLDVTVEVSTGAVEGRLLFPDGRPAARAVVALVRETTGFVGSTGPSAVAESDGQGAFALRVPAGTYKLFVHAEGFDRTESRVVVTPGGTVHLDIALGVSP